jgi:hypothetical protein
MSKERMKWDKAVRLAKGVLTLMKLVAAVEEKTTNEA